MAKADTAPAMPEQLLRRSDVAALLGHVSLATIKRWTITDPEFPPAYPIGPTRTCYRAKDVIAYQQILLARAKATHRVAPHDPRAAGVASGVAKRAKKLAAAVTAPAPAVSPRAAAQSLRRRREAEARTAK